jgi:DNA-directed RNA polymerase subunit alpha
MSIISETETNGSFSIEPLFPGYGSTLGNALRRVLLSSLEGAAVDYLQIEGVDHEFSSIPHVKEDVIQIILNLKTLRFKLATEMADLSLHVNGSKMVTGADFNANSDCEVVNKDHLIANLEDGAEFDLRIHVIQGRGYLPVEKKEDVDKTVGTIYTDSIFTPVLAVSYKVENMRVGKMTNYDRLLIDIQTDGSVLASRALQTSSGILMDQYRAIANISLEEIAEQPETFEVQEELIIDDNSINILKKIDVRTRISDTGLSGRTIHALETAGYKTISGLKRLSDVKLESIKGLGEKGLEEVRALLSRVE